MLSTVKRYQALLSSTLARYFPRTSEYLRAEREAAARLRQPQPRAKRPANSSKTKTGGRKQKASDGPAPAPIGIYSSARLKIDESQIAAMRERVAEAVAAGLIGAPSDEQWAMILCRAPLARIFAGAGSGKSTTLLLRVVFMLCHLRIPATSLTVISFTNASCAELRGQLLRLLAFWQFPFDEGQARQCVRTFHSAMALQAKALLATPNWFEQLGGTNTEEPDAPNGGRLPAAQQRLLRQAHDELYASDATFRQQVHELLGVAMPKTVGKPPQEGLRLAGELRAAPLFEVFYQQACFAESLGLRPDQIDAATLDCGPRERLFLQALARFWTRFQTVLQAQGVTTFDAAFRQLGERLASAEELPAEAIEPLRHLLIDEFQDISPQIVHWLQAVHRALAGRGKAVSLMAIGDDWQSIYGWRGSSPELFLDFDRHFPSRGKAKSQVLMLTTNFRSIEPILRDAEALLEGVACKQAKRSQAVKKEQPGDHGVRRVEGFDLKRQLPELLQEISTQCAHVAQRGSRERNPVLLLGRRNDALKQVQAQLGPSLPVRAYSIHRSKGLQGEVAIILDDGGSSESHPLRNALYAHCGLFRNSYDQAMRDESLRLAYVAATRGVSRVIWFAGKR
ncbi:UvrD-helicase domain-containing protein [Pseudomonas sp. GOM6]|uniref:UvrD-helicase domain-containing protein n=1 Tax=Pseudomonas sp. GOM6 TaxID=3036944 RepID=UPI00240947FB|nr:UvrD-helicase domain-containing protein [Pseudomonas sp. GOM6]MDG1582648.1 UvrD-helicase domain-containing protein [Pseudomonas sp. GOM6]